MEKEFYDVMVIGAGPVGSYVARQLAGHNYKVAVLEEHERIGDPMQCTGIIGVECFERFHLPIDSVLREARSASLFSPCGKAIQLHSNRLQAYIADRTAFDSQLANSAKAQGARYFTLCRATDISIMDDRVRLYTDSNEIFDGRVAVIASGFYCKLPQKLGLEKFRDFITGAQAEVTIKDEGSLEEIEIYFDQGLASGFFAWLVPTAPQRALAGLFSRKTPRKRLQRFIKTLYDKGRIVSSEVSIMHGGIPLKPRSKTYCERVIIVGDAAGQVKPTTGGGVYYGLLCADAAAGTLHKALSNNDLSARTLAGYQMAWQKEIGRELRNGYYARRIYEKLSNRGIDQLFDLSLKKGLHEIINESNNISFDWHSKTFFEIIKHGFPRLFTQ